MLKSLLSLFLQSSCPLCQRPAEPEICQDCSRQLQSQQLKNPAQFWRDEFPLFVWGNYEGKLKQALAALKYDRHAELGEIFGRWIGQTWLESSLVQQKLTLIPIPLHAQKLKERGFNQAELIARGFSQVTGYPIQPHALIRFKETKAMYRLKPRERAENLKNAFKIGIITNLTSKILLIDDIYTTGTTAKEAANCLRSHQIPVIGIATLASSRPV